MSRVKKLLSLILALAMIFSLAACEKAQTNSGEDSPKEGNVVSGGEGAGPDQAQAVSEPSKSSPNGTYLLEDGEAVIDDVDFSSYAPADDNNRVFYEIFVGSFSDSDGDGIGDLQGIINRLDYLNDGDPESGKSLGVEGIWLTPIFSSRSYHKYDCNDYYTVDARFGDMDTLKALIDGCHERGIKIILDLVINHTGRSNPWFSAFTIAHREGNTEDPYYDFYSYYTEGEEGLPGHTYAALAGTNIFYECNFSGDMPELNYDNPDVRQAVLDVAKFYLDMGIDGFRFDASKYLYFNEAEPNVEFWKWYIGELKSIDPDVYTVAEVWDGDGVTDLYYQALNCFDFTTSQTSGLYAEIAKSGDCNRLTNYVESYIDRVKSIREDAAIVPFISNHDMDRCAGYLTVATYNMQMAANLYILGPGSPFIYYGEELGMRGSRGGEQTDANRRLAMVWGDGDTVADPEGSTYPKDKQITDGVAEQAKDENSLYTYYKKLLMIRAANPEIARGDYHAIKLDGSKVSGFESVWNGSSCYVFHNPTTGTKTVDLSQVTGVNGFSRVAAYIGEGGAKLDGMTLTIDSHTSVVLR